jgi:DNA-binding response OmpR family regulator
MQERLIRLANNEKKTDDCPTVDPVQIFVATPIVQPVAQLRIMIVEDDALIGMLLGDMLEIMGHEVCAIVSTESAAVAAALRCKPNMMIVDAHLREGSGIAAVDQIIAGGFIPHIFVTGDVRAVQSVRAHAIVIAKPFNEAELAIALSKASRRTLWRG